VERIFLLLAEENGAEEEGVGEKAWTTTGYLLTSHTIIDSVDINKKNCCRKDIIFKINFCLFVCRVVAMEIIIIL
jgi:hypothetical protein